MPQKQPVWDLSDILTPEDIGKLEARGQLVFHTVGDTGFDSMPTYLDEAKESISWNKINKSFYTGLQTVASAMAADIDPLYIERGPAFFLHLGDVIYYDNSRHGYAEQFYEPFKEYGRKIIAIPGNHDIEVRLSQQNTPLEAFLENFCHGESWVPPAARATSPPREMPPQPAAYWRLDSSLVQIVGLCSNVGEEGGTLFDSQTGPEQYAWFKQTMAEVAQQQQTLGQARPPLFIAVHHPPFTHGNHDPSTELSNQLDEVFKTTVWPDVILSAHDHNYQRFTRTVETANGTIEIPYFVVGNGGRYSSQFSKRPPEHPPLNVDVELKQFGAGNGYLTVTVRKDRVDFVYRPLDHEDQNGPDSCTLDVRSRRLR